ncbi:MAG TPA: tetratricopeptide repeat protein, partial [Gemmatimonadaceae bacterium]
TEALAISEDLFGREHAALSPLLNELGRLYINRSQFARAEDVLERLLAIARAKGDENADVATVLAGLAVVKRKLGDDESAEALFRDALRIREKVLEPNHMVTVVTLEHLSETCAARGNLDEALTLLRRALATREVALDPGHPTVQAARSRIAELELRIAVAADMAAAAAAKAARASIATPVWLKRVPESPANTPPTPAPSPIDSKKPEFLGEPEPRVLRPAPFSRDRATPTVTAAVAAASLMASSIRMPSGSQLAISPPPPESAPPSRGAAGRDSGVASREAVLAYIAQIDVASEPAALDDAAATVAPVQADLPEPAPAKRTVLYASVGAAAVATAIVGMLLMHPRASAGGNPVPTKTVAAQRTTANRAPVMTAPAAPAAPSGSTVAAAAAVVGATRADSLRSASATNASTAAVAQPEQRASDDASPELHLRRVDVQLGRINIPNIAAPSVESIGRSVTDRPRASDTGRIETGERVSLPTSLDVGSAVAPAKIVGRMPEPVFPDALLRAGRRDGLVVVRFIVNEFGRADVASMIVERSDDELFTSAVRDILPDFRFEPARTHAPESKPVASWVSVPFRFTTKKR